MKINSELKKIFEPLRIYVLEYLKKLGKIEKGSLVYVYVKTPHIFYKKVVIYVKVNSELIDITNQIENDEKLEPKWIKSIMAKAYMNYFVHYQSTFNKPYYKIDYSVYDDTLNLLAVSGSESPDPIDANGTVIRK